MLRSLPVARCNLARSALCLLCLGSTAAAQTLGPAPPEVLGTAATVALVRDSAQRLVDRARRAEADGHPLDAEALYQRALGLHPALLDAHLGYARCLDARGLRSEAVAALDGIAPHRLDAADTVTLADALNNLGATDLALARLRRHPHNAQVLQQHTRLAARAARFAEALAAARAWYAASPDDADAERWVRALVRLVAEADAVEHPDASGEALPPLRRVLARSLRR